MVTTTDYLSIKRGTRKVGPDHRVVVVDWATVERRRQERRMASSLGR